jgi:hypothetical protein
MLNATIEMDACMHTYMLTKHIYTHINIHACIGRVVAQVAGCRFHAVDARIRSQVRPRGTEAGFSPTIKRFP